MNRLFLLLTSLCIPFQVVFAQGTLFTYQGRLTDGTEPADGLYDFRAQLYNRATPGEPGDAQIGSTIEFTAVPISNGLFTLALDFGPDIFNGNQRWLLLAVRTNNNGLSYSALLPRQHVAPTPYAIHAAQAAKLQSGAAPVFDGTVTFSPASGPPFNVISTTKVPNLNADLLDGLDSSAFVHTSGDTMTGTLEVNGPGGRATLSDVGSFFGNDIAISGTAASGLGVGVNGSSSGASGYGVLAQATGTNGTGVYATANNGVQARAIHGQSSSGLAGFFQGGVRVDYASPFNKPQLELSDPSDSGFSRLRIQTGSRPFWDIAVGTGVGRTNALRFFNDGNGDVMWLTPEGQLHTRVLTIMGGADIAEPFQMTDRHLPKGTVVIIDEDQPGALKQSTEPYDTRVAGIISGAGGVNTGLQLQQQGVLEGDQPVALTGRVYVQADASNGAIKPGNLLTTSSRPGHAMKVTDHARAQGAILGKAITGLNEGTGLVLVLVTLQ